MCTAIRFAVFALVLRAAMAQTQPDLAEILKRVSQAYKANQQYELIGQAAGVGAGAAPTHVLIAFKPPNRYRTEGTFPNLSGDDAVVSDTVIICDDSIVWFYLRKSNQYGSMPLADTKEGDHGDLGDMRPEALDEFVMGQYRRAADFGTGAKLLREEAIEVAGTKVDCYVVAVPAMESAPASTWWIDKRSYRIWRGDDADSSATFTTVKLNESLPDDLFKFKPPLGAQKLEMHR